MRQIQRELDETRAQLHSAEYKLHDAESMREQLEQQREQITQLHSQLHDEQLQRSVDCYWNSSVYSHNAGEFADLLYSKATASY